MRNRKPSKTIVKYASDILDSGWFEAAKHIPHHPGVSVAEHSLSVAEEAAQLCAWLKRRGISVNERDVVRSALLHDIAMVEDEVHDAHSWVKAYTHPVRSAEISESEFGANEVQTDAIRRHMWPICMIPPRHKTGWVVLLSDKKSSVREVARHWNGWRKRKNRT